MVADANPSRTATPTPDEPPHRANGHPRQRHHYGRAAAVDAAQVYTPVPDPEAAPQVADEGHADEPIHPRGCRCADCLRWRRFRHATRPYSFADQEGRRWRYWLDRKQVTCPAVLELVPLWVEAATAAVAANSPEIPDSWDGAHPDYLTEFDAALDAPLPDPLGSTFEEQSVAYLNHVYADDYHYLYAVTGEWIEFEDAELVHVNEDGDPIDDTPIAALNRLQVEVEYNLDAYHKAIGIVDL